MQYWREKCEFTDFFSSCDMLQGFWSAQALNRYISHSSISQWSLNFYERELFKSIGNVEIIDTSEPKRRSKSLYVKSKMIKNLKEIYVLYVLSESNENSRTKLYRNCNSIKWVLLKNKSWIISNWLIAKRENLCELN